MNYKAIEELYFNKQHTLEAIQAITGTLELNKELKALDDTGDLITLIKTKDLEGNLVIEYVHRTTKGDGETPISFTLYVE